MADATLKRSMGAAADIAAKGSMSIEEERVKVQGLERFRNRLCKVIFVEDGREQVQKGKVTGIDENFVYLETFTNFFAINQKDIVKIKSGLDGRAQE